MAPARDALDVSILAGGILYVTTILVFRFVLGAGLDPTSGDVAGFGAEFARLNRTARATLTPIGVLTSVLVLIALVREGGLGIPRGRLRIAGIAALAVGGLLAGAVLEPLEKAVVSAADAGGSAAMPLLERWQRWQLVLLGIALVAGGALVLADRAARPVEPSAGTSQLTRHHRSLLLLLAATTLFEGYDRFIVSLALPSIAGGFSELQGLSPEEKDARLAVALALIRTGALFAILLGQAADRFGRRRLLLVTVLGYTIATFATGLSASLASFVVLQMLALTFLSAELSLAQVVVAEEFPPGARGAGQAMLGASAALGAGLVAMLFPVMEESPLGWRGLYFVGVLPLLLVGWLRRSLPETTRWSNLAEHERRATGVMAVLRPAHRVRFAVLMLLAGAAFAAAASAFSFASYRARTVFDWTPGQVSAMVLTGGGLGFWGWVVFGRLADVVGRRWTGAVALVGGGLAIIAFYRTPYLMAAFTGIVFFEAGVSVAINALSTEVFPTALRATAKVWVTNAAVIGAMIGLGLVGMLADRVGGHALVIAGLGVLPMLFAPLLFVLPETHKRELEKI
jgi:MFS family permease